MNVCVVAGGNIIPRTLFRRFLCTKLHSSQYCTGIINKFIQTEKTWLTCFCLSAADRRDIIETSSQGAFKVFSLQVNRCVFVIEIPVYSTLLQTALEPSYHRHHHLAPDLNFSIDCRHFIVFFQICDLRARPCRVTVCSM